MLWACILLPHLAIDDVVRRRGDDDAPLVLVDGPAQARRLLAVNPVAAAAGLRAGQRLSAAQALLAQFSVVEHDPAATARAHQLLAAWAYRYSGEVVLWPQAVVLEISKSLGLFGPWPRFEQLLRQDLVAMGFRHRLALAPTARAAHVLAGVSDGLAIDALAALSRQLQALPLEHARLPGDSARALHGMGIRQLGPLLGLPREALRRRFGGALIEHLDRLSGREVEPLAFYRPPDHVALRMEWAHEIAQVQALVFPLRRLTADLAAYLAGRDGGVQHFVLRLEHRDHSISTVPVGLLSPERDAAMLFELARGRLESLNLPQPVVAMGLQADELPPFVPAGRELFDSRPAQAVPLQQLRERLRARLGEQALHQLYRTTDPRPERAQSEQAAQAATGVLPSRPRPAWLLPQPVPWQGAPPRLLAGPERLETGWWDGDEARRDYYLAETAKGQRAWIYAAAGQREGWMLHGWFA